MKIEKKTMRDVFIEKIYERMHEDASIFFLSGDFGSPKLDKLREEFSERFINVGIAEQNLINIATGLALEGFTVYAYAIAPFLSMRAYEQIRNLSLLLQTRDVNVNLVAVGAGLSYDVSGPTHHCLEDITIMRTLPNIMVFSPSDWTLAQHFLEHSIQEKVPKYLRFDGKPLPQIYRTIENSEIKKGFCDLVKGSDVCLVSTGFMTHRALNVAEELKKNKIDAGVIDVFMLKPLDEVALFESLKKYTSIVTIEEGFINRGGLDSLIIDILIDNNSKARVKRIGFKDKYVFDIGNREHLHKLTGLNETGILKTTQEILT